MNVTRVRSLKGALMNFGSFFDRIAVVYLPERRGRHRSIRKQVDRLKIGEQVHWFKGLKFQDKGQFPKASVRGCVMSNYELLRQAAADNVERLLLFQEDCVLSQRLVQQQSHILEELDQQSWDFAYFGCQPYDGETASSKKSSIDGTPGKFFSKVDASQNIRETHFWACNGRAIPKLVKFMESTFDRPIDHPEGGPTYFDGYMNRIRQRNLDLVTLAAVPRLGWPLSSASGLTPGKLDRIPVMSSAFQILRGTKNIAMETTDFIRHGLLPDNQQLG